MKIYFEEMFVYERWANNKVFAYVTTHPSDRRLREIFNHLVADALPWLLVLRGETVPEAVIKRINDAPNWPINECQAQLDASQDEIDTYLASLEEADFGKVVTSTGPHGQAFPNTVAEVLTHLLSHGQHHRGQIEWLAERETGAYLATSFMPYLRDQTNHPA